MVRCRSWRALRVGVSATGRLYTGSTGWLRAGRESRNLVYVVGFLDQPCNDEGTLRSGFISVQQRIVAVGGARATPLLRVSVCLVFQQTDSKKHLQSHAHAHRGGVH
jgi:hypothetical protein